MKHKLPDFVLVDHFSEPGDTPEDVRRKIQEFIADPYPIEDPITPDLEEAMPTHQQRTPWVSCVYRHVGEGEDCASCKKLICGCEQCPKFGLALSKTDCKDCPHQKTD